VIWERIPCEPRVSEEIAALARSPRRASTLLFCGPPGSGKRAAAVALAQALLCDSPPQAPCGACSACRRLASGQHPDFNVWEAEGREVKVDQARALRSLTQLRPFEARLQVHLMPEAERMNEEASNALLKTLEEPSPRAVLILLAASPALLLPTIRSRCQAVRFPPLSAENIRRRLESEDGLAPAEAAWRARLARGSLVRARGFPADEEARTESVLAGLEKMTEGAPLAAVVQAAERWSGETPPERPIERLLELCRDALVAAEGAASETLLRPELEPRLRALGRTLIARLPAAVERLDSALSDLRRPMKPQLLLEEALFTLLEPA
jgi:DNA polymerase-3 subunit delta'